MFEVSLCYKQAKACPKCGALLYREVWESERKVYVVCEQGDCGYEDLLEYEYLKFSFGYRDEFTTEITAKSVEDAIKELDNATWKRTGYDIWQDYLSGEYVPVFELEEEHNT